MQGKPNVYEQSQNIKMGISFAYLKLINVK